MIRKLFTILYLLILSGCANGGFFGEADKVPHPGVRENIFSSNTTNIEAKDVVDIRGIPAVKTVDSWIISNNFQYGDIQNIKFSDQFNLQRQASISWENGQGSFAPVVAADAIYLYHNHILSKFSFNDLGEIWSYKNNQENDTLGGSIVLGDGKLFLADGSNILQVFASDSGKKLWEYEALNAIRANPVIKAGIVYFVTIDNSVYAIDVKSGAHKWVVSSNSPTVVSSPIGNSIVVLGNVVIVGQTGGNIEILDIETGNKNAEIAPSFSNGYLSSVTGGFTQSPMVIVPNLYFIDDRQELNIFNLQTAEYSLKQTIPFAKYFWVSGNYSFVLSTNNNITAIDNTNSKILWQQSINPTKDNKLYPPMLINSRLMVFSKLGLVYIFDIKSGKQIAVINLGQSVSVPPVIYKDMLITVAGNGKLMVWN